jgi:hypothetical protein
MGWSWILDYAVLGSAYWLDFWDLLEWNSELGCNSVLVFWAGLVCWSWFLDWPSVLVKASGLHYLGQG